MAFSVNPANHRVDLHGYDVKERENSSAASSRPAFKVAQETNETLGGAGATGAAISPVAPARSWKQYCPDLNTIKNFLTRIWAAVRSFFASLTARFFREPARTTPLNVTPSAQPVVTLTPEQQAKRNDAIKEAVSTWRRWVCECREDINPEDNPWVAGTTQFSAEIQIDRRLYSKQGKVYSKQEKELDDMERWIFNSLTTHFQQIPYSPKIEYRVENVGIEFRGRGNWTKPDGTIQQGYSVSGGDYSYIP